MDKRTKKLKGKYICCTLFSTLLLLVPMIVFVIIAFINGSGHEKFTLGITVTVSMLFVLINLVFKKRVRSTIWILILGIYVCLDNISSLLLITAISTMLDEFILEPLGRKYKQAYTINKEIDKRAI